MNTQLTRRHRARFLGVSLGALALAITATGAAAQQAPAEDTTVEEVVVTGFRSSLAQAIQLKRADNASVDVITSEDVADFPDLNLAESLQRIPGVSIARDAGEGRQISVRGLGPAFTRVRINGMEALTTTGGTDSSGGTNRSRGFDFNVFASELFNSITVRKTPSAEVDEGSLGATVDLQTARPFDFKGFTLAASGQLGWNDLSDSADPRGALLIANTWADGRFGALFSIAYGERRLLEEGHSTVRWQQGAMSCKLGADSDPVVACPAAVNSAFTPRIPRYGVLEHEQKRLGATGALQWRPADSTLFNLDLAYAKLDATRAENFLEVADFSNGNSGQNPNGLPAQGRGSIVVRDYEINGDNDLIFGRFDHIDVRSESRFDELSTEFFQATLSGSHEFSDRFRVNGMVGRSTSKHDNPVQTTLLFDRLDTNGYSYDYRGDDRLPLITYGFDVTDPSAFTLTQIRLRPQTADNTFTVAQGDFGFDFNEHLTLKGGGFYKSYTFETTELRRSNGTTSNLEGSIPASIAGIPTSQYARLIGLANAWKTPNGTVMSWAIPDLAKAADLLGLYNSTLFPLGPEPSLGNNRSVDETDSGAYVQLDFNTDLGGLGVRGNAGVRYVRTDQSSRGFQLAAGTPVAVESERDYSDWLPSLNLVFEPSQNFLIRAAVAKVLVRPGLGALTPGGSVTVSGNNRTVNAGNPLLDPTRATTYDLSFEWYFAPQSLVSLAVFHKQIDSFVANQAITRPFTGNPLGIPDSVAIAACGSVAGCNPAADWTFNQPVNTKGGDLTGFEIGYQQPFFFLPGVLDNFGMIVNYTYVNSEIEYPGGIKDTLTGLSKHAYNATLYYEDDKFSARVSAAYRDGYLSEGGVPGQNGNTVQGVNSTLNFDAAASYKLTPNVELTFEAINLTDEPNNQFVDDSDRVLVYHHTGRQFYFGARYKF